jgi:hypothetical protein
MEIAGMEEAEDMTEMADMTETEAGVRKEMQASR